MEATTGRVLFFTGHAVITDSVQALSAVVFHIPALTPSESQRIVLVIRDLGGDERRPVFEVRDGSLRLFAIRAYFDDVFQGHQAGVGLCEKVVEALRLIAQQSDQFTILEE